MGAKFLAVKNLDEAWAIMTERLKTTQILFQTMLLPTSGFIKHQFLPNNFLKNPNQWKDNLNGLIDLSVSTNVLFVIKKLKTVKPKDEEKRSANQNISPGLEFEEQEVIHSLDSLLNKWSEHTFEVHKAFPNREWYGNKVIILGDPGFGKSNSAFLWYLKLMSSYLNNTCQGFLPILISAKQLENCMVSDGLIITLKKEITRLLEKSNLIEESLKKNLEGIIESAFKESKLFLIIDGLDELGLAYRQTVDQIFQSWSGPILFTSRVVSFEKWGFAHDNIPRWQIRGMSSACLFLDKWAKFSNLDQLKNSLENKPQLEQTLRIPLLAAIACKLAEKDNLVFSNRTNLLEKMVKHLLDVSDRPLDNIEKDINDLKNKISQITDESIKTSIHQLISVVEKERLGKSLDLSKVLTILGFVTVKTFKGERWTITKSDFVRIGKEKAKELNIEILDVFDFITGPGRLFTQIYVDGEEFEILHQALVEVLVALGLNDKIEDNSAENIFEKELKNLSDRFYDPRFHEVFVHFGNILCCEKLKNFINLLVPDLLENSNKQISINILDDIFDTKLSLATIIAGERKKDIGYLFNKLFKKMVYGTNKSEPWHLAAKVALHQADQFKKLAIILKSEHYKIALIEIKKLGNWASPVAKILVEKCINYMCKFNYGEFDPNAKNDFNTWILALETTGYPILDLLINNQKKFNDGSIKTYFRLVNSILRNHQNFTEDDKEFLKTNYKDCLKYHKDEDDWYEIISALFLLLDDKKDLLEFVKNEVIKHSDLKNNNVIFEKKLRFLAENNSSKLIIFKVKDLLENVPFFNSPLLLRILSNKDKSFSKKIEEISKGELLKLEFSETKTSSDRIPRHLIQMISLNQNKLVFDFFKIKKHVDFYLVDLLKELVFVAPEAIKEFLSDQSFGIIFNSFLKNITNFNPNDFQWDSFNHLSLESEIFKKIFKKWLKKYLKGDFYRQFEVQDSMVSFFFCINSLSLNKPNLTPKILEYLIDKNFDQRKIEKIIAYNGYPPKIPNYLINDKNLMHNIPLSVLKIWSSQNDFTIIQLKDGLTQQIKFLDCPLGN